MIQLDQFRRTYFEECAELLEVVYARLAELAESRADVETLHAIFRAVHSMKGGGGAFGFDRLVAFAHQLETLLDMMRNGQLTADAELVALLFRATDMLSDLVEAARLGSDAMKGLEDELAVALLAFIETHGGAKGATSASSGPPKSAAAPAEAAVLRIYRIGFTPLPELFRRANEPLLLLRELRRQGETEVVADISRLPDLEALVAEDAYLSWEIRLRTTAPKSTIEEIFEFVADDCALAIEAEGAVDPAISPRRLDDATQPAATKPAAAAFLAGPGDAPPGVQSIRVDVDKVDRVVNLAGELVINQAMLMQLGSELPPELCPALVNGLQGLAQHLRELQESVMAIRAQPIKSVFSRMPRLVREVASQLGKDIKLVITGETTEIDKTVIEQLADPLTHLLRNALDHGIEMPDDRAQAGKPRQGTIHLGAEQRSGRILIEIADDGRGIDREKVLAKARPARPGGAGRQPVRRGDRQPDLPAELLDRRERVEHFGARRRHGCRQAQHAGAGRTHHRRLADGLGHPPDLVAAPDARDPRRHGRGRRRRDLHHPADQHHGEPAAQARRYPSVVGRCDVMVIRGAYVPLVYLHRHFDIAGAVDDPCQGIVVIVESETEGRIGLVVDELLGQQQVVVKSLEVNYQPVVGVSGATILGSGRVALILDVTALRGTEGSAARSVTASPSENAASRPH